MKSTGVIRRIDELGRIVIPKEIRRNLGIRDGENVEIYTESDSIILKKYNRLNTSSDLASTLCDIINNVFNYKVLIADREKIIAESGISSNVLWKKLPPEIINLVDEREINTKENYNLVLEDLSLTGNFIFVPIISLNDSIGTAIMYNENNLTGELQIGKLIASIFARKLDI